MASLVPCTTEQGDTEIESRSAVRLRDPIKCDKVVLQRSSEYNTLKTWEEPCSEDDVWPVFRELPFKVYDGVGDASKEPLHLVYLLETDPEGPGAGVSKSQGLILSLRIITTDSDHTSGPSVAVHACGPTAFSRSDTRCSVDSMTRTLNMMVEESAKKRTCRPDGSSMPDPVSPLTRSDNTAMYYCPSAVVLTDLHDQLLVAVPWCPTDAEKTALNIKERGERDYYFTINNFGDQNLE